MSTRVKAAEGIYSETVEQVQEKCKMSQGTEQLAEWAGGALKAGEDCAGLDGLCKLVDPLGSVGNLSISNATERVFGQAAGCRKSASVHWALNKMAQERGLGVRT